MRRGDYPKSLSVAVLVIAVALLIFGIRRHYEVLYLPSLPSSGPSVEGQSETPASDMPPDGKMPSLEPRMYDVSDRRMVENATFSGIVRDTEGFTFKYDPSKPRGKQACPT